ncbi:hypothetical protein [Alicyclobacillus fodiniaquatilis]|jgi:hypothetical protein|uniref:Uncharacterized protein n=1 Tax=Alicyclobacillus fodiniaquatilis TaxID=1661150 RepID=A0ABW4JHY1_9BACL
MSLWENIVAIFVLACAVPLIAISETNITHALQIGAQTLNENMVARSVLDRLLAGESVPAQMEENHQMYTISITRSGDGVCTYISAEISLPSSQAPKEKIEIPACPSGVFTD